MYGKKNSLDYSCLEGFPGYSRVKINFGSNLIILNEYRNNSLN